MKPSDPAARSPWSWLLALAIFVALCVGLPRSEIFWIPVETSARVSGSIGFLAGRQAAEAARKLELPTRDAAARVALLGNSRIWFGAPGWVLDRELRSARPGLDVRVDNLAFFGARIGDLEMVSRHLGRGDPQVVVLALGGGELVPSSWGELVNQTGRFFDVGWADGPIPPASQADRAHRWLKTALPLVRLRLFARRSVAWRLAGSPAEEQVPAAFADADAVFRFVYGPIAPEIQARYHAWRAAPSFEGFVSFLEVGDRLRGEELPGPETLGPDSPGTRALDVLLARMHGEGRRCLILLLPDNPLLRDDVEGRYHRPGFRARAAGVIRAVASRHGARVVDGRTWVPAEGFLDFYHPMPDVGGLHRPLAQEILRELDS